jgi:hypothetical protein
MRGVVDNQNLDPAGSAALFIPWISYDHRKQYGLHDKNPKFNVLYFDQMPSPEIQLKSCFPHQRSTLSK